MLLSKKFSL